MPAVPVRRLVVVGRTHEWRTNIAATPLGFYLVGDLANRRRRALFSGVLDHPVVTKHKAGIR